MNIILTTDDLVVLSAGFDDDYKKTVVIRGGNCGTATVRNKKQTPEIYRY